MIWRADARTNKVALSSGPKPVTAVRAKATTYRPTRTYVGTLQPWIQANVGPQLVSAYVDTVLVRPGAIVKKGEVIATLDCREASASTKAIAARARALDARQQAVEHEASRTQGLLQGGFVSPNEAEQKTAQSTSEAAQVEAERANLARSSLEVNDCIMRAPFNGEVAQRAIDPGAFVRPGNTIVTVVDRDTVRMTADAPETDFDVVAAGTNTSVHVYATKKDFAGTITRRSPAADPATRTVHFEIDLPDPARLIPVGTTGEVHIEGRDLFALDEDQRAELRGRSVGFVFQSFQLLPALTALENVMLPLELSQNAQAEELAVEMLRRVGLGERLLHYPKHLSGGEQQRVALARAFVVRPRLLFADEPTGSLDAESGAAVIRLLFEMNREYGTTLVLVTHDEQLAARCQRSVRLVAGRIAP